MNSQIAGAEKQLEDAFQVFNQFSEKLANSYSGLESHVARLTKELAQERDERLLQLAEKELLAKRLEGLLDALPAGIVVIDSEDRVVQTNPVAREMLGLQHDSDKGPISESDDVKQWKTIALASFVSAGDALRLKDGRWVNVSACSLGEYPGKVILISDVTETHKLEAMLNQKQRLSSLGTMIASLAHQLRTPLSSALLFISGANHPVNDESQKKEYIDKAKERLRHLERMINDMLIFAKGDVDNSENINVMQLFTQLDRLIRPNYKSNKIVMHVNENLKDITIRANADALISAIQNLIDNAVAACIDNNTEDTDSLSAKIEIYAFLSSENLVTLKIKDYGCGMSEEVKERAMEPFYTTRISGTGLGLAVVNATVGRYNGEMELTTKQGEGTEFIIKFPCSTAEAMLASNMSSTSNDAMYISKCV